MEEALGRLRITSALGEDVEHIAVLVSVGSPLLVTLPVDVHENLVGVPVITKSSFGGV